MPSLLPIWLESALASDEERGTVAANIEVLLRKALRVDFI
jgi:hypothetical protein